jgi:hypothetical protein
LLQEFVLSDLVFYKILHRIFRANPNIYRQADDGDICERVDPRLVVSITKKFLRKYVVPLRLKVGEQLATGGLSSARTYLADLGNFGSP